MSSTRLVCLSAAHDIFLATLAKLRLEGSIKISSGMDVMPDRALDSPVLFPKNVQDSP